MAVDVVLSGWMCGGREGGGKEGGRVTFGALVLCVIFLFEELERATHGTCTCVLRGHLN